MATFETSLKSRLIYVFAISDEWHKDCLKVGETTLEEDDGNFPLPNSEILNKAACIAFLTVSRSQQNHSFAPFTVSNVFFLTPERSNTLCTCLSLKELIVPPLKNTVISVWSRV